MRNSPRQVKLVIHCHIAVVTGRQDVNLIFVQIRCSSSHISLVLTFKIGWARPLCNGQSLTLDEKCASCHQPFNQSISFNFILSIIMFYNPGEENSTKFNKRKKKAYIQETYEQKNMLRGCSLDKNLFRVRILSIWSLFGIPFLMQC